MRTLLDWCLPRLDNIDRLNYTGCQVRENLLISLQRKIQLCNILNHSVNRWWCPGRQFLNHSSPETFSTFQNLHHTFQNLHHQKLSPWGWSIFRWNIELEKEIPYKAVLEIKYLEALQTHLCPKEGGVAVWKRKISINSGKSWYDELN